MEVTFIGYKKFFKPVYFGSNSSFIDVGSLLPEEDVEQLDDVVIKARQEDVSNTLKKFQLDSNVSQSGGRVLQGIRVCLV